MTATLNEIPMASPAEPTNGVATKKPRKPRAAKATPEQLAEQLANMKLAAQRKLQTQAITQITALHETLTLLGGESQAVAAGLFILEALDAALNSKAK